MADSELTPAAPSERTPFVRSDIDPLVRVLVHSPGPETGNVLTLLGQINQPMFVSDLIEEDAPEQHRGLVERLRSGGAEVLFLQEVLDEAIEQARSRGALEDWLRTAFPRLADLESEITASVLLGAEDRFVYRTDDQGWIRPLTPPLNDAFYTRDQAVMTSRGLILGHFEDHDRALEPVLLRFALRWAPALRFYPVAFDAAEHGVYIQGGDVIVLDERTLLVGVGHRTDRAAAPRLARTLGMDVIAVQMPTQGDDAAPNGIRALFLHLDSIVNLVAERTVLAVPYFLEAEWVGRDPLTRILRGLGASMDLPDPRLSRVLDEIEEVGWVTRYQGGSGEADEALGRVKLLDYLRSREYRVVYVGGQSPGTEAPRHALATVLREMRFQAANVVATEPGRVIAYAGNHHTIAALREAGLEVDPFCGAKLARWHGGPHCMTLPLERGSEQWSAPGGGAP